ncbi:class I SAM-dependent methyltransferase [Candidatus Woesearchaeota archaeon]|nr:MAG: Methylase involved in ubiquinone/menaquinone biosynthesis [archaeon GW2011_AR4]MBS3129433.1 class I SAM-dependent methyltransferase [Candidatus Woesearchaeota archaeon]HIH38474.1 class I SAM-dependent methyltransferase [Candidatus Woesearchaeota archaeon]HIH49786.1 class I SAM-dependent methyltransferase [Candidatus Woesearchaeota archaeon]HIJ03487.1 class I SAM-dependent methyltransferase [Candidatus Woesearchaeota archaeon]
MPKEVEQDWESHYVGMKGTFYESAVQYYRKHVIAPTHRRVFEKAFPKPDGIYCEVGCGTAQASTLIRKKNRTLIALDISFDALKQSHAIKQFDVRVKGDAFRLPFKDESLDGIWNHGLYEHFTEEEIHQLMSECARVLKKGGGFYTFWPPMFSLNGTILRGFGLLVRIIGKKFDAYPGEITRPWTKGKLRSIVGEHFHSVKVSFPARNLWGDFVVVAKK